MRLRLIRAQEEEKEGVTNVTNAQTPTMAGPDGGDSGYKPTIQDAAKIMDKEVQTGKSTREAARVAAEKTGQKEESVRKAHQRAEKKSG